MQERREKIRFNPDKKFDLQLGQAVIAERRLADIFEHAVIEKIEVKTETWQWEQTGNIAIEYEMDGHPSGIATTLADMWVHELRRDDTTLVYLMFPVERLKQLAREHYKLGHYRRGGDGNRFMMVLVPLGDVLR